MKQSAELNEKGVVFLSGTSQDTGVASYSKYLLDALDGFKDIVVVYYDSSWSTIVRAKGYKNIRINVSYRLLLTLYMVSKSLAKKYLRMRIYSIIEWNTFSFFVFNTPSPFAALSEGYRIVPIHDLMHKVYPKLSEFKNPLINIYRDRLYSHLCLQKDVVVVTDSKIGKSHVQKYYIYNCKIEVNYFPIPRLNIPSINSFKSEYSDYFYYPAAFWDHKNHFFLINAFRDFLQYNPRFKLIFSGPDRGCLTSVRKLITDISLEDNVKILPYVSDEKKMALLRSAKALVFPSMFGPTNIPPLESYSLGVNCVVADIFGAREQLANYPFYFHLGSIKSLSDALKDAACSSNFRRDESIEKRLEFMHFQKRLRNIVKTSL